MLLGSKKRVLLFLVLSFLIAMMLGCGQDPVKPETYTLAVQVVGEGFVNPTDGQHFEKDAVVEIIATPKEGWRFKEWIGDVADTERSETTMRMFDNSLIKAVFIPKEITRLKDLEDGSLEGVNIVDNTAIGYWSVSFLQSKLPDSGSNYALMIGANVFYFAINPFNADILETNIPDIFTVEQIREGILYPTDSFAKLTANEEIFLKNVVIQKGNNLCAIELSLFTSMRNAEVFVFDDQGRFIAPSYVGSSEGNYYTLSDFISARNVVGGPIGEAFALLSENPDHIQPINPHIVKMENGEIICVPPYWILRDLGSEGSFSDPNNVYNIIDNTNLGYWSVSLKKSRLPSEFSAASSFSLTINGETFVFEMNPFDNDIFEVDVPDTYMIEEVRDGKFEMSDVNVIEGSPFSVTVETGATIDLDGIIQAGLFDGISRHGDRIIFTKELTEFDDLHASRGVGGEPKSDEMLFKYEIYSNGRIVTWVITEDLNAALFIFVNRRGINNYITFGGNYLNQSVYGTPENYLVNDNIVKMNVLASYAQEAYRSIYNEGFIENGPDNNYELFNKEWSLNNYTAEKVTLIRSNLRHHQMDFGHYNPIRRPVDERGNEFWSPISSNPDQNANLARSFDIEYNNNKGSMMHLSTYTDNGMHSNIIARGISDLAPDYTSSGGIGSRKWEIIFNKTDNYYQIKNNNNGRTMLFLQNEYPNRIEMSGRTTWSHYNQYIGIAVYGGDINTTNHSVSPSPSDCGNRVPFKMIVMPGENR